MNNWLYSPQCLEQVESAAVVRDPSHGNNKNQIQFL